VSTGVSQSITGLLELLRTHSTRSPCLTTPHISENPVQHPASRNFNSVLSRHTFAIGHMDSSAQRTRNVSIRELIRPIPSPSRILARPGAVECVLCSLFTRIGELSFARSRCGVRMQPTASYPAKYGLIIGVGLGRFKASVGGTSGRQIRDHSKSNTVVSTC
jgi:hypothetical protein